MSFTTHNAIPIASEIAVIAPGHDHEFHALVEALRFNASGTVIATLRDDSSSRKYVVAAGDVIPGRFTSIVYSDAVGSTTLVAAGDIVGLVYGTAGLP